MWILLPLIWPVLPIVFIQMKLEEFFAPVIELFNKVEDAIGNNIDLDRVFGE